MDRRHRMFKRMADCTGRLLPRRIRRIVVWEGVCHGQLVKKVVERGSEAVER